MTLQHSPGEGRVKKLSQRQLAARQHNWTIFWLKGLITQLEKVAFDLLPAEKSALAETAKQALRRLQK